MQATIKATMYAGWLDRMDLKQALRHAAMKIDVKIEILEERGWFSSYFNITVKGEIDRVKKYGQWLHTLCSWDFVGSTYPEATVKVASWEDAKKEMDEKKMALDTIPEIDKNKEYLRAEWEFFYRHHMPARCEEWLTKRMLIEAEVTAEEILEFAELYHQEQCKLCKSDGTALQRSTYLRTHTPR